MEEKVMLSEMLSSRQLKKLSKSGKALRNRRIRTILQSFYDVDSAPREELRKAVDVSESTFSSYLNALENTSIVELRKVGRRVHVQLTPFGKRILNSVGSPKDLGIFSNVTGDANRVRIIEAIAENGGQTFTKLYYCINRSLEKRKEPEMTTALLSYHLRVLKSADAVSARNSNYHLTANGKKVLQIVENIFS